MKTPEISLKKFFFLLLVTASCSNIVFAQSTKKESRKDMAVKNLIQSGNYVFKAESVMPMSGITRQLTTEYDMKISKDTITTYLPYFGRAYVAPIDPNEGGIDFRSTDFDYTVKGRKKGGWDILIQPKDTKDVRQLDLTVFNNGQASLMVTSNNRQAISFNGYIAAKNR